MNSYFEQMILSASPVELVRLLYKRAIGSVRNARQYLREGRIQERCEAINNAWAVLMELSSSLRTEEAAELARNLSNLYCYMQGRLVNANLTQDDAPLAETLALLVTLSEAWDAIPDSSSTHHAGEAVPGHSWRPGAGAIEEPARFAVSA